MTLLEPDAAAHASEDGRRPAPQVGPARERGTLRPSLSRAASRLPGVALCLAAAALSWATGLLVPGLSPMIVAIVLGVVVTNATRLPASLSPGVDFSAKVLLRVGIVFLGLQLVLGDILGLGAPMLLVVLCVVGGGILGTVALGRWLRVPRGLALLIACGFSICGAAAVAGAASVTDPDDDAEDQTVTAVALVVIFGTAMIALLPLASGLVGVDAVTAGMWGGASVHEIAQVVAVGGILGPDALAAAVVVKLARVLLLAPVVAVLGVRQRRITRARGTGSVSARRRPPLVPPFVVGFLALVLLRALVTLPAWALTTGHLLQTVLLSAAMFALGCGVRVQDLRKVGARPFVLAALATLLVSTIAGIGVTLAS